MIEIIFLDVDGCMSDGGIYKTNLSDEFKRFDVKDGFAIQQWNRMGKISAIITGKSSQIVADRAKELEIKYCFQGVSDKLAKALEILELEGLGLQNAAAIGDEGEGGLCLRLRLSGVVVPTQAVLQNIRLWPAQAESPPSHTSSSMPALWGKGPGAGRGVNTALKGTEPAQT